MGSFELGSKPMPETWSARDELLEIKSLIKELTITVKGNGQTGLVERVSNNMMKVGLLLWLAGAQTMMILCVIGKLVYDYLK